MDEAPIVPNGEVLELASAPNPDAAKAEDEVSGCLLVVPLGAVVDVASGDLLLARAPKGDTAEVLANPLVAGI